MSPDPTERNVNPFLFQAGIRAVKKLVLALTIHDENVTMAKPTRASITIRTDLPVHLKSAEVPKLTETMSFVSSLLPNRGSSSQCHPTREFLPR